MVFIGGKQAVEETSRTSKTAPLYAVFQVLAYGKVCEMNLNTFRVFLTVYEQRSMTLAASFLHLTQSGISQHIRSLEEELGFPLFERVNKKLFPTAKASELYSRGKKGVLEIENALSEIQRKEAAPRGRVRIGLPVEFGNNVVIPELSKLGVKNPDVDFVITLDFATILSGMVLRGELDFALIDRFDVDPALKVETVASETLLLCGLRSYVKKFGPVKYSTGYFSKLHYVDYQAGEPIVRSWFRHHIHRHNINIRVRAHIFDVQGISKFIRSGLGVGILPDYVVAKLEREGVDLHVFEGKRAPLKNDMCLIYLPLKDRALALKMVMDCLRGLPQ
jgi:DNA-binding transcriptional LysR family regulator